MNKLFNDDALNVIDKLINKWEKVDAIITDPPFNLVEKSGGSIHLFRQSKQSGNGSATEKSMSYDTGFDQLTYLKKLQYVIKKGGNLIIFNDWENLGDIAKVLRANGFAVKQLGHWQKTNPLPSEWRRRIVAGREYYLHCIRKGAKHTFNTEVVFNGEIKGGLTKKSEKAYGKHPNQKPLYLMEKLVEVFTNEGDTILDLFMGSASTGVAAQNKKRNFIGVEMDKDYFQLAANRLKGEVNE